MLGQCHRTRRPDTRLPRAAATLWDGRSNAPEDFRAWVAWANSTDRTRSKRFRLDQVLESEAARLWLLRVCRTRASAPAVLAAAALPACAVTCHGTTSESAGDQTGPDGARDRRALSMSLHRGLVASVEEMIRVVAKLDHASLPTERVLLALMNERQTLRSSHLWIDGHPAHAVFGRRDGSVVGHCVATSMAVCELTWSSFA